jgi:hypothetical protein
MSTTLIEVLYALYEKTTSTPPQYVAVTTAADLALEVALRASDPLKLVVTHASVVAQNAALHDYVQSVPFDLPVLGHSIEFATMAESRWDPDIKDWVRVQLGGAIHYAVPSAAENATNARLQLAVWTKGAVGEPAADALNV